MTKTLAFKGFDAQLQCLNFQFELNKSYTHNGQVIACEQGFHACEYPLDIFGYYPPSTSRFGEVELSGETSKEGSDTKIATAEITIKRELKIPELVAAAVRYIIDRTKRVDGNHATEERELIKVSGDRSIATVTSEWSAATATGYEGKVRDREGCALFLVERNDSTEIVSVWSGMVGRDGNKVDACYTLKSEQPVETD
ncbi:DUF7666 domain-containing protein [Ochrobactrum sp. EDr1-4]|uniref:DUF7666 domain-containing protein n=1 Tax=Ochrobactrum sp. EDr1-4 TaxID=3368622 RepID=UPI003B9EDBC9